MPWLLTGALIAILSITWLTTRFRGYRAEEGGSEEFSIDRYQPMTRLLAEEDFLFLAAQPGYGPEIGEKFRKDRRRVFRLYLNEMAGDFRRLHAQARAMVAESQEQHAELVGLLMRQQLRFWRVMTAVELRLMAHQVGVGRVDVRRLVDAFEAMRVDLVRLSGPAPAAI